jgi:Na+/H+-dicarboxylate symporter
MFGIPPKELHLILPIDHFCDMFRTGTNVLGNALATSVVSKWEESWAKKKQAHFRTVNLKLVCYRIRLFKNQKGKI